MKKKLISMLTAFCLVGTSTLGGMASIAYANTATTGTDVGEENTVVAEESVFLEAVEDDTNLSTKQNLTEIDETTTEETGTDDVPEVWSEEVEYYRDPETGHISSSTDYNVPVSEKAMENPSGLCKATLPTAYQWFSEVKSTYPATRDQNPYGTCWAFGTTACAEFDLIKNHGLSSSLDLSELGLAYYTYHTANDKLENLDGDKITYSNTTDSYLDCGGNTGFAIQTLSQWKGFTYESAIPYSNAASTLTSGLSSSLASKSDGAKLVNSKMLDIKNNPEAVKQAIQTYGAVSAAYYHGSSYYALSNGYSLYYCPYSYGTNHVVAIVGWNDNISASYFPGSNKPSKNGAWLVRNSWSTNNDGSEYCYFYMSYDDASLANAVFAIDVVPGSTYANIYQHDGTITTSSLYVKQSANIFTAQNPDSAGSETLDAVMLDFTYQTDVSYKIDIYTGLTSSTNPESGYHHTSSTTTGTTDYVGVYTIPLKQKVYLRPGEKYAIVVTCTSGNAWVSCEANQSISDSSGNVWFSGTASVDAGESLYKTSSSASNWTDCASDVYSNCGNFKIKGLTNNSSAKKYTVSYNLNGGTAASGNPSWYLSTSSSTTLKTPTKDGYHFLGWYTDSSFTNKITTISGSLGKNLTLYAKWEAHSYDTETVVTKATASTEGTIHKTCSCGDYMAYRILVPSVKLAYTKTTYNGSSKSPTLTVSTENGTISSSLYSVSYSNNVKVGRGKVTITMPSAYYSEPIIKYFSIVPKAPSSVTAKLSGDYNNIKVTWKKATGADGYYVYYKKASASSYSTKNRVATTKLTTTFKNLNNGVKYTFKVVPYFVSGSTKYTSIATKTATAATLKKVVQKAPQKASSTKVKVRWNKVVGTTYYQVSKATKKSGTNIVVKKATGTSIKVSASKGKTYWYKVRAYRIVDGKKIYGPWSIAKKYKL